MYEIIGQIVVIGAFIVLFFSACFAYVTLPFYLGSQMGKPKERQMGYFEWLKQDDPFADKEV